MSDCFYLSGSVALALSILYYPIGNNASIYINTGGYKKPYKPAWTKDFMKGDHLIYWPKNERNLIGKQYKFNLKNDQNINILKL